MLFSTARTKMSRIIGDQSEQQMYTSFLDLSSYGDICEQSCKWGATNKLGLNYHSLDL